MAPSHLGLHAPVQVRHDRAVHGGRHQEKSHAAVPGIVLDGTIEGHSLRGATGTLDLLGPVTTRGILRASGANSETYRGQVTLIGASGHITARLSGRVSGPVEPGTPIDLTYRIIKGHGAFKGARGTGRAEYDASLTSRAGAVVLTFVAPPSTPPTSAVPPSTDPSPTSSPPDSSPPRQDPPATEVSLTGTMVGQSSQGASGTVDPLGAVTGSWTLTFSGAEPVTLTGTATLVGASGTLTASLAGRLYGATGLYAPIGLTYTITGGTGAFAGATGSGQAAYSPSVASPAGAAALTFGDAEPPPPPPPPPPPGPLATDVMLIGTVEGPAPEDGKGTIEPLGR